MTKIVKARYDAKLPEKKTSGAACYDAYASIPKKKWVWLKPTLIPLGFKVELEKTNELLVRGRSGLTRSGHFVCLGTVDSDYRGEVAACVWSLLPFRVKPFMRIAQIAIREIPDDSFVITDKLSDTERGEGGFGHTGV